MGSTKMYARLRCGGNLPLCLAFGTGVLGVLWWLGGWVVGIRYRRGPFTVRKGHSVHENPLFLHGRRFPRHSV